MSDFDETKIRHPNVAVNFKNFGAQTAELEHQILNILESKLHL